MILVTIRPIYLDCNNRSIESVNEKSRAPFLKHSCVNQAALRSIQEVLRKKIASRRDSIGACEVAADFHEKRSIPGVSQLITLNT
jgi:hypothetical protein